MSALNVTATNPSAARMGAKNTTAAIRRMVVPGMLAVISPVATGFIFGPEALGGMLAGLRRRRPIQGQGSVP